MCSVPDEEIRDLSVVSDDSTNFNHDQMMYVLGLVRELNKSAKLPNKQLETGLKSVGYELTHLDVHVTRAASNRMITRILNTFLENDFMSAYAISILNDIRINNASNIRNLNRDGKDLELRLSIALIALSAIATAVGNERDAYGKRIRDLFVKADSQLTHDMLFSAALNKIK
jgi:hypothetical protein